MSSETTLHKYLSVGMYIQKSNISKLKNEVIEVVPEYTNSKYEDLVGSFLKNHFFFFPEEQKTCSCLKMPVGARLDI